ncbi:putative 2-dehydropantoate 2-reductase [Spirulina sp. CS-785/01]|uniref:putative 2-dehydropantoate 2-reductase n=1 Tax=Spirulina sp. CS-785/01 TaxID=3021716 RepID=UPI00232AFE56|nr:putative 2-dehydropantoate 2-reductase [Spirulina sp. CS-785/01]MDB9312417.1 putative 2-dehydropantoate 2-reductase [Spirulina sp. CS-785/01]
MGSYAIIGTGAVGGYYGACLQRAGFPVHFLLRSDYEQVKQQGLTIESVYGDFTLPQVKAYNATSQMPPCDVVLVTLKTTQNYQLSELLPPLLHENSVIILLQNGLGFEAELAQSFPKHKILGGLAFICANKVGAGQIRHLDYQKIKFAEYAYQYAATGVTETLKQVGEDFKTAQIEIELGADLLLTRWEKLVWNIPYNGLSVVLDAKTNEIMANPWSRQLVEALMEEVVLGAKSSGRLLDDSLIQTMLDHTDKMTPYFTSMKLDYNGKRPLEVEGIVGNPLRFAHGLGVELPRIEMLYQQLKYLDYHNAVISH